MKLSTTCTLIAAALMAQATAAQAKAYKGAEVYTRDAVLYGRMEMRMQMMRGSGLVSTFFTYKNGSEAAGATWEETDIEVLGKSDATTWQSNLITGSPRMTSEQLYTAPSSLADGYHTYTLEWTPDYVSWSFDGTMVRKTQGGQASSLINAETLRFNAWASDNAGWTGALDEAALPAYQFVNWIKYYRYDNGKFVLDWADDFDSFDTNRWATGNWTFDGNLVDFDPANAVVQDSTLILAITNEGATGFGGSVPVDEAGGLGDGGVTSGGGSGSGCAVAGTATNGGGLCALLLALVFAVRRGRRRARPRLALAALLVGLLAPRAASAVQSSELYRSRAYFYGRFEARVRFAPGDGAVSSFFLWKDGSSTTTSWNELDFEKIEAGCRLQTNIWTGKGTQNTEIDTPAFDICGDYHTYAFEWTPDYIAWFIDGAQVRKVTGASVNEYTQNASQGMAIHFNLWQGDSTFGGTLNPSTLPVHEYISWVQYSSYDNGAFQQQWREEFDGSTIPSGWATGNWLSPSNHSTHNPANVTFANGIAVLSMTADNATGYSGTPPADSSKGGAGGTAGGGAGGASSGPGGRGGAGATAGMTGTGGTGGTGGMIDGGRGGTTAQETGGTSPAGRGGGTGAVGAAGSGAGGVPAGAAGSGAGGVSAGTAGSAGAPSGHGGASMVAGSGGAPASGRGGAVATGGSSGAPSGAAGDGSGSGTGCGCRTAGGGPSSAAGLVLALLLFRRGARRRSPSAARNRRNRR
jgi:endo-1,3-1,4-beta-glycanase ExoK